MTGRIYNGGRIHMLVDAQRWGCRYLHLSQVKLALAAEAHGKIGLLVAGLSSLVVGRGRANN